MDEEKTGSIIIKGGTVKATGGTKDAGIGTEKNHSSGFEEIAIYGGNVTAQGGKCGAGIGAGRANSSEKGKKINIYGGTIKATGGDFGAGIGGGEDSSVDVINIYDCEKITANGGKEAAGIGSGNEENNHGTINISGGKVTSRGGENAAGIGGGEDSHGENITTVGDAYEPVATETYKVKDYADVIIANKDGKFSDKLITLVKTMLNYGAKAQIQFEHNTDALANTGIDYELVGLSENEISDIAGAVPDKNHINALLTESKIEYYGYSLILKTKTTLRFYFKKNGANTSQLELVNDAGVNVGSVHDYNADYCYIEISDIASAMLSECYTLQYGVVTLGSFSALSYVKDVLQSNGGKQPITDTVTALYRYQEAAVAYFDNNQEGGQ